jgi:hypothetical protein
MRLVRCANALLNGGSIHCIFAEGTPFDKRILWNQLIRPEQHSHKKLSIWQVLVTPTGLKARPCSLRVLGYGFGFAPVVIPSLSRGPAMPV